MKRIAANKVLTSAGQILPNAVVETDDNGTVQRIFELAECTSEPSNTLFYNGLLTTFVPKNRRIVGQSVAQLVTDNLTAGYNGRLLLWQGTTGTTLQIKPDTKIIEI